VQKGVARGEVFGKDFPKTSPRPPQEWESEERHLGIEKTVEHGEVLGKCRVTGDGSPDPLLERIRK
jgi:hypothetical protein